MCKCVFILSCILELSSMITLVRVSVKNVGDKFGVDLAAVTQSIILYHFSETYCI